MLTAPTLAQIESIVHGRIRAVLAERVGEVARLSSTDKLSATLGLSSLDLAFVVAELEAELGVDPFAKLVSITCGPISRRFFPSSSAAETSMRSQQRLNELRPDERGESADDGRQ
jgi:acyl carrier protein